MFLCLECDHVKESYIKCLKRLRQFRKSLSKTEDEIRGKLYFNWIKNKTDKVEKEKDEEYIYRNISKYTLKNYVINQYTYNKSNKILKSVIKSNYIFKDNKYIFNNQEISIEIQSYL